jgi:hypothetical protein
MPSWKIKETNSGDAATIEVPFDGLIVTGFLHDCDGEFISWSVKENGNQIAGGELRRSETMTHDQCWNEAKRLANMAIMSSKFLPQPTEPRKPRVVKDFADIGENPKPKKKAVKHGGREKGERRAEHGDKWADA